MSLTLAGIFYIYLGIILLVGIFSFFNIYHLIRFAPSGSIKYITTAAYLIGLTILIGLTLLFLQPVDWTQTLEILPGSDGLTAPLFNR